MKRVILKEEELRDVCKIDQRQLRKFLVTLKVCRLEILKLGGVIFGIKSANCS